jgi:hypothetical protein
MTMYLGWYAWSKKKGAPGTLQTISLAEIKDLLKEKELP